MLTIIGAAIQSRTKKTTKPVSCKAKIAGIVQKQATDVDEEEMIHDEMNNEDEQENEIGFLGSKS